MHKSIKQLGLIVPAIAVLVVLGGISFAANTPTLNQTINAGTLTTDITDGTSPVASPSVTMTAQNFSFTCQTSTGTLGTNAQRLYVSNPGATIIWTLSIAPTAGTTASWTAGANHYDFNDPGNCSDGADTDTYAGQMTINPAAGSITPDCSGCTLTGITTGASGAFSETGTVVSSITLMHAGGTAQSTWNGYLTGATLSQSVPAQTPTGSYSLPMTLTVVNS